MSPSVALHEPLESSFHAAPRRVALVLAWATAVLLLVGGAVTSSDAGMAFAGWLKVEGHFFLTLPVGYWLLAAWEFFIEHVHRLLATVVGVLAIVLVCVLGRYEPRRWVRRLGWLALATVVLQGVLGGLRVELDRKTVAMVHGCVGPAFFVLTVALAVVTSRRWHLAAAEPPVAAGAATPTATRRTAGVARLALITLLLAYLQLVLGAALRHMPASGSVRHFAALLTLHLGLAGVVALHVLWLSAAAWRVSRHCPLRLPSVLLAALIVVQLGLGAASWVVQYGFPGFLNGYALAQRYVVRAGDPVATLITTGHQWCGSLLLALALLVALRSGRAAWPSPRTWSLPVPVPSRREVGA
jgi:cytochrome c oxidase assembly protein subunit 15